MEKDVISGVIKQVYCIHYTLVTNYHMLYYTVSCVGGENPLFPLW